MAAVVVQIVQHGSSFGSLFLLEVSQLICGMLCLSTYDLEAQFLTSSMLNPALHDIGKNVISLFVRRAASHSFYDYLDVEDLQRRSPLDFALVAEQQQYLGESSMRHFSRASFSAHLSPHIHWYRASRLQRSHFRQKQKQRGATAKRFLATTKVNEGNEGRVDLCWNNRFMMDLANSSANGKSNKLHKTSQLRKALITIHLSSNN